MVSKQLLEILICPESRQPLAEADTALVARLNAAIAAGQLRNKAGETIARPIDGALVRQDGQLAYPIVDDIPVMLLDEAIPLDAVSRS